jgi:hypothetical protein
MPKTLKLSGKMIAIQIAPKPPAFPPVPFHPECEMDFIADTYNALAGGQGQPWYLDIHPEVRQGVLLLQKLLSKHYPEGDPHEVD